MKRDDRTIPQLVVAYVAAMEGLSGSITLHIHEGKVVRVEKREMVPTATMALTVPP